MKKKLSLILTILIIINTLLGISSLAIEKEQTVEENNKEKQEIIADYNKLYGILKLFIQIFNRQGNPPLTSIHLPAFGYIPASSSH